MSRASGKSDRDADRFLADAARSLGDALNESTYAVSEASINLMLLALDDLDDSRLEKLKQKLLDRHRYEDAAKVRDEQRTRTAANKLAALARPKNK